MKIAIVAPVIKPILKEQKYGGIERIISSIVKAACKANHQVFLYAPLGSNIDLPNLVLKNTINTGESATVPEKERHLFERLIKDQDIFDLIHCHIEPIIVSYQGGNLLSQIEKPFLITMHNQTYVEKNISYYKNDKSVWKFFYVFVSKNQEKPLNFLPNKTVIYNGININLFTFESKPNKGQLAFFGRVAPDKGIVEAIKIAKKAGKILKIGAYVDPSMINYYKSTIKPLIDDKQIIDLGELNKEQKNSILGSSEAYLFPIKWQEPFGLTMVEALATGTPVIAPAIGSTSEVIENGKNGFLVEPQSMINQSVKRLNDIQNIDRSYCRKTALEKFSEKIMIKNYLSIYESVYRRNRS